MLRLYALMLVVMLALSVTLLLTRNTSGEDRQRTEEHCSISIRYQGQTAMTTGSVGWV